MSIDTVAASRICDNVIINKAWPRAQFNENSAQEIIQNQVPCDSCSPVAVIYPYSECVVIADDIILYDTICENVKFHASLFPPDTIKGRVESETVVPLDDISSYNHAFRGKSGNADETVVRDYVILNDMTG